MATGRVPTTANSPLTAKGDLFGYSTTQTRVAVGNDGEQIVADSSATTGLRWQADFAAGKNKIINGDFRINQRNFSSQAVTAEQANYTFDRFYFLNIVGGTTTCSAQTFTAGAAPVAGYEGTNFIRLASTGQTSTLAGSFIAQGIEDVRTFAGQTVTVSFWAKATSGTPKVGIELRQFFGTGGSSAVELSDSVTISTSWVRYSKTFNVPSISGKTIGANNNQLSLDLWTSAGTDFNSRSGSIGIQTTTIDFWGVQVEAGSVATAFQTATGTFQGELAACQRYFYRYNAAATTGPLGVGSYYGSTTLVVPIQMKQTMRTAPSATFNNPTNFTAYSNGAARAATAMSLDIANTDVYSVTITTSAATAGNAASVNAVQTNASIDFSSEL
jgi:hypothetical protein